MLLFIKFENFMLEVIFVKKKLFYAIIKNINIEMEELYVEINRRMGQSFTS